MTAIEDAHGDVHEESLEGARRTLNKQTLLGHGMQREKKKDSLMKSVEEAPDFSSWSRITLIKSIGKQKGYRVPGALCIALVR